MTIAQRFIAGYAVYAIGDGSPVGTIEAFAGMTEVSLGPFVRKQFVPLRFQHEGAPALHHGGASGPPLNRTRKWDEDAGHWRS